MGLPQISSVVRKMIFLYKTTILALHLLLKSEGFLALSWDFTVPMKVMVLEKKCGCAAEALAAERRRSL